MSNTDVQHLCLTLMSNTCWQYGEDNNNIFTKQIFEHRLLVSDEIVSEYLPVLQRLSIHLEELWGHEYVVHVPPPRASGVLVWADAGQQLRASLEARHVQQTTTWRLTLSLQTFVDIKWINKLKRFFFILWKSSYRSDIYVVQYCEHRQDHCCSL